MRLALKRPVKSAMVKVAIGVAGLVGLFAIGCGAEPFSLSLDGGIAVTQGSGGFPAGTGGDIITVPGSGGADGSGGAPVVIDASPPEDATSVPDAAPESRRDATPRDASPPGPLTLFNCYVLKTYVPDAPYNAGDRVFSLRDLRVFQCRPWPNSGWCSIGAYEPGGPLGFWPDAWTPLGYCE